MPDVVFTVDQARSMREQAVPGHNRWHPDIPVAASVRPGSSSAWSAGSGPTGRSATTTRRTTSATSTSTARTCSAARSGSRARSPAACSSWTSSTSARSPSRWAPRRGRAGVTRGSSPRSTAVGSSPTTSPTPTRRSGTSTASRPPPGTSPGCATPGSPIPACSAPPSAELLAEWTRREGELVDTDPRRVPPLALLPLEKDVLAGTLGGDELARVGREGARTVPARENGGNHDIKNLTRGSRIFYPVHVPGAKLSGGDLHFSQGDGEITFCGAIEMGGFIDFGVDLIKGGMEKYAVTTNPVFMPGNVEPRYSEFLTFIGISVEHERNFYLDASIAYRRACLNAIEYLKTFGYSGEQAYLLLGSAPIEGRISGVVDIPNACCSLYLPTAIFDFDIRPTAEGPRRADRGRCAVTS